MSDAYVITGILIIAAVTALIRFAPFAIFGKGRQTPKLITYLGKVLPAAIMGMLVVYCLRNTDLAGSSHGLAELIATAVTVALHLWRKNSLISIGAGTAVYMCLVQLVFG